MIHNVDEKLGPYSVLSNLSVSKLQHMRMHLGSSH